MTLNTRKNEQVRYLRLMLGCFSPEPLAILPRAISNARLKSISLKSSGEGILNLQGQIEEILLNKKELKEGYHSFSSNTKFSKGIHLVILERNGAIIDSKRVLKN